MSILASAFQCDADSKIKNATTRSPGTLNLGFSSARPAAAGSELKPTVRVTDLELAHPGNYNATEGHSPNWV
jgi:hypothetical protein